jgi:hypothetical protein
MQSSDRKKEILGKGREVPKLTCDSRETPDDTMMSKEVNTSIGNASIGP